MLHINDLLYRIGDRILFEQATIAIAQGHRVGLVGRNGTGKTTLFRLILGELSVDDGKISIRNRAKVGTVAQEAPAGPESLIETVLAADTERAELLARAEVTTDPHEISEVHIRLADISAETAPARAARILAGLGFDEAAQQRPCSEFSGGWRMRVSLAAVLFSRPDFLLLDEPTNHLDLEASMWLENYLIDWPGTLLVISHDRRFLNRVINHIIHIENLRLNRYTGNYDQFEDTRRERLELDSKMRTRQMAARKHIQSFVDRFRYSASKARQAQSRIKMLERMQPIASATEDRSIAFNFPDPELLSPPLISIQDVAIGYEANKPILKNIDLRIDMDDRIGLIGANGNGKSTMMKLLADRLKPMQGKLVKSSKLKIGYFAQHQSDELHMGESPYQHLQNMMPMVPEAKVRAHTGRFGFTQQRADVSCENLSGGEKARLLFAMMSLNAPHVMLLDEPTNHLDVDAREALVHALNTYKGAVILVSHDAHLVELVCDRLWLVEDSKCAPYDGDLSDYAKMLVDRRRIRRKDQQAGSASAPKRDRKQERRDRAAARAESGGLRKSVKDQEKLIEKYNHHKEKLQAKLADPALYESQESSVTGIQIELAEVISKLEKAEQIWIEATEKLDSLD